MFNLISSLLQGVVPPNIGVAFLPPDTIAIFLMGSCGTALIIFIWHASLNRWKKK